MHLMLTCGPTERAHHGLQRPYSLVERPSTAHALSMGRRACEFTALSLSRPHFYILTANAPRVTKTPTPKNTGRNGFFEFGSAPRPRDSAISLSFIVWDSSVCGTGACKAREDACVSGAKK